MGQLKLAVIGTGWMGKTHAKNLVSDGEVRLVGVCGTSVEKAGALMEGLGELGKGGEGFTDAKRMLRKTKPDLVVVAIPPSAHGGQTQAAARRGCHLLLEKPIALTLKAGLSMSGAAIKGGGVVVVGHHMRYGAMCRRVGELIANGSAGRVTLVQGRWFCNALHGAWWRDVSKSGGQVVEQAIHTYDLACWYAGKPVGVSGLMANLTKTGVAGYTVEDTHASVVQFEGGAMGSLCASNAAVPKQWENRVTVVCEKMAAEIRSADEGTITWSEGKPSEEWWASGGDPKVEQVSGKTDLYAEVARGFLASVRAGRVLAPAATMGDAVASLGAVLGVVRSSGLGGKWVKL